MRSMLLVVGLFALACGKKAEDPGPTCDQVVDHMLEVTKQQMVGHGAELKTQKAAMVKQCEDRKMPAATRRCLVAAKSLPEIAECRAGKKPEGAAGPGPARPPAGSAGSAAPAPAGSATPAK